MEACDFSRVSVHFEEYESIYRNWIQTDYYTDGINEEQIELAIRKLNGEVINNNTYNTNSKIQGEEI